MSPYAAVYLASDEARWVTGVDAADRRRLPEHPALAALSFVAIDRRSLPMTTRRASCCCGQLTVDCTASRSGSRCAIACLPATDRSAFWASRRGSGGSSWRSPADGRICPDRRRRRAGAVPLLPGLRLDRLLGPRRRRRVSSRLRSALSLTPTFRPDHLGLRHAAPSVGQPAPVGRRALGLEIVDGD